MDNISQNSESEAQDVVADGDYIADNNIRRNKIIDYDKELPDHLGRVQRLEVVIAEPMTLEIVIQRVIDGESLRQIAQSWKLPVTRFVKWISDDENRLASYEGALRIRADELAHEALEVATIGSDDIQRDKLTVDTNLKVASFWDKQRYGNEKSQGGSGITVIVNRDGAISAPDENTVIIDG